MTPFDLFAVLLLILAALITMLFLLIVAWGIVFAFRFVWRICTELRSGR